MKNKVEELTSFIQERCLWQFHSRTWDREENIEGVLTKVTGILTGEPLDIETAEEKCFYADAKILAAEFKDKFPWLNKLEKGQIKAVIEGVKERITEITVTKSLNGELNVENY